MTTIPKGAARAVADLSRGVILATVREHISVVEALSGSQIAVRCGYPKGKKDDLLAEARRLISGDDLVEATAAGIAALVLANQA